LAAATALPPAVFDVYDFTPPELARDLAAGVLRDDFGTFLETDTDTFGVVFAVLVFNVGVFIEVPLNDLLKSIFVDIAEAVFGVFATALLKESPITPRLPLRLDTPFFSADFIFDSIAICV
jgi:hypothetical protein